MLLPLPWVCHTTPPLPRKRGSLAGLDAAITWAMAAHRMELVIARDLLDDVAVVLEQHEAAQIVQQHRGRQHAAHQRLQLVERAQRVERDAVDRAPGHESLGIRRQRAQQRIAAVRNDQHLVVLEDIGYLRLVGLDLMEGLPHVGIQVGRVLQLDQREWQTVDEQHDVGPARVVRAGDGELVDRQPLVACRVGPVHQPHEIAAGFAVTLVLHRDTGDQQPVKLPVGGQQHRRAEVQYLPDGILAGSGRHVWVQSRDGLAQPAGQHHLAVALALGMRPVWGHVGPVAVLPTHVGQPAQSLLFKLVFGHRQRASSST